MDASQIEALIHCQFAGEAKPAARGGPVIHQGPGVGTFPWLNSMDSMDWFKAQITGSPSTFHHISWENHGKFLQILPQANPLINYCYVGISILYSRSTFARTSRSPVNVLAPHFGSQTLDVVQKQKLVVQKVEKDIQRCSNVIKYMGVS